MAATTSRMPEQYQPLQEEEVDDVPFTPLKALQNVGVQQADIKKLSEAGFATVEQILMTCCSTPSRARPRRRSRSHPAASTTPRTEGGPPPPASHKDTLTSSLTAWIQIKD